MRLHPGWYLVLAGVWKRPWCWLTDHVWIEAYVGSGHYQRVCRRCTQRGPYRGSAGHHHGSGGGGAFA